MLGLLLQNKAWLSLCFVRLLISLVPQYGYIHPDEFFQTVEVAAGQIFGLNVTIPWEFNGSSPVRSWCQVVLSSYPPLYLLKFLSHFLHILTISPHILLIFERVYCCLLSFIVDFSLYKYFTEKASNSLKQKTTQKMAILASSSVMLVFASRSFTNSLELVMFSLLFLPHFKQSSLKSIVLYSFIPVLATFIRPTFLIFALVPYLFRFNIVKGIHHKLHFVFKHIFFSFVFSVVFVLFDSYSYSLFSPSRLPTYIKQHGLKSFLSTNLTITPLNFILYNSNPHNLATHGTHSRLTHSTINMLLLFNALIIIAYKILITNTLKLKFLSHFSIISLWFVPLSLLSIFPHQEARFLIPLIIPLTISYARPLCRNKLLLTTWIISNLTFTLFYGFTHQAGLIRAMLDARKDTIPLKEPQTPLLKNPPRDVELIFWKTYMPPRHLLLLPSHKTSHVCDDDDDDACVHDTRVHVTDLAGSGEDKLRESINNSSSNHTFIYVPGSVMVGGDCEVSGGYNLVLINKYWPHFTGENLFFEDSNLRNINCDKSSSYKLYGTLDSYFSFVFGFQIPDAVADFMDKTSFKVFRLQQM